jgi:hypothetical protein
MEEAGKDFICDFEFYEVGFRFTNYKEPMIQQLVGRCHIKAEDLRKIRVLLIIWTCCSHLLPSYTLTELVTKSTTLTHTHPFNRQNEIHQYSSARAYSKPGNSQTRPEAASGRCKCSTCLKHTQVSDPNINRFSSATAPKPQATARMRSTKWTNATT